MVSVILVGIISKIRDLCSKHNLSTEGIGIFTFQKNRSTTYSSVIIDFANDSILPNYPLEQLNDYKEIKLPNGVLLCYKTELPPIEFARSGEKEYASSFPCCSNMISYRNRRIINNKNSMIFLKKMSIIQILYSK